MNDNGFLKLKHQFISFWPSFRRAVEQDLLPVLGKPAQIIMIKSFRFSKDVFEYRSWLLPKIFLIFVLTGEQGVLFSEFTV